MPPAVALSTPGAGNMGHAVLPDGSTVFANGPDGISVYAPGLTGTAIATRTLGGDNIVPPQQGGYQSGITDVCAGPDGSIYAVRVDQFYSNSLSVRPYTVEILTFAPNANGNAVPQRIISTPGVLTDGEARPLLAVRNGFFYLMLDFGELRVFPVSGNGVVASVRTLTVALNASTLARLAVAADGSIFLTRSTSLEVYAPDATGTATPVRTISGASTQLETPVGIALDTTAHELYVTSTGSLNALLVFPEGANGNVTPLRSISGPNSGVSATGSLSVH